MQATIKNLFSRALKTILKDKIIFVPYLIFLLSVNAVDNLFHFITKMETNSITIYLIIYWFLELIFKALTISMSQELITGVYINIKKSFLNIVKKFHHLLIGTLTIFLPILYLLSLLKNSNLTNTAQNFSLPNFFFTLLIILIVFTGSIILEFVPLMVICNEKKWFFSITSSILFIKNNFINIISFFFISVSTTLIAFICTFIFKEIPIIGPAFFKVFFQGINSVFLYCLIVVLYYKSLHTSHISPVKKDTLLDKPLPDFKEGSE
jgi:hypothetical protein